MAQDTITKQANGLVTQFIKKYTEVYKKPPVLNRYREKWGFQDMISDLGVDRARLIVDYYFHTSKAGHPVAFLLNNYDKIGSFYQEKLDDEKRRAEIRRETAQRVKEWEEAHGNE